ncbi:rifin [Plasmodium sp. gorilla clade G1]|nr:rifin [Plasmodium sp. gorilla clade G1]
MNLHYSNILLFSFSLNILVLSTYAHNKNKPCFAPRHIRTITSRVLSECDINASIYDKDPDMKSVKEIFDRQTSQRFEEYNERMITQRKKCKEQRDKDVQKIILNDKIEKSLEEKVEKFCLRCGCGLGGVAAGVGLFGGLGTYGWKISATAAVYETAKEAGIQAGIQAVIVEIKKTKAFKIIWDVAWENIINGSNYSTVDGLFEAVKTAMNSIGKPCISHGYERACSGISNGGDYFISSALKAGQDATALTTEGTKTAKLGEVTTASSNAYGAIGYSVTVMLIIVLVMVIIYLILRYRRKKKMNKKLQYTKLLNQ